MKLALAASEGERRMFEVEMQPPPILGFTPHLKAELILAKCPNQPPCTPWATSLRLKMHTEGLLIPPAKATLFGRFMALESEGSISASMASDLSFLFCRMGIVICTSPMLALSVRPPPTSPKGNWENH